MASLLTGLGIGLGLGISFGAIYWRRSVISLNKLIVEKDNMIAGLQSVSREATGFVKDIPEFAVGLKMYRTLNFKDAFPILLHHAERNHPDAASIVAKMYFTGNGVAKNEASYQEWLAKAADLGDKSAKANLKKRRQA